MGKTSLLRRLAIGVRDDPDLSAVLLPLTFREEQYNVHNLRVFGSTVWTRWGIGSSAAVSPTRPTRWIVMSRGAVRGQMPGPRMRRAATRWTA